MGELRIGGSESCESKEIDVEGRRVVELKRMEEGRRENDGVVSVTVAVL